MMQYDDRNMWKSLIYEPQIESDDSEKWNNNNNN